MPYVQGYLNVTEGGQHPDNSLPPGANVGGPGIDNSLPFPPPTFPPPVPTHPIVIAPPGTPPGVIWPPYCPPSIDNTLPPTGGRPDNSLPEDQPGVDNTLPGGQPPRPDNTLPGQQTFWVVVWIPGYGWRYVTVDPSLSVGHPLPPTAQPK